MSKPNPWTEEEDAVLRDLWPRQDESGATIGAKLGRARNAVIGRAHRIGLAAKRKIATSKPLHYVKQVGSLFSRPKPLPPPVEAAPEPQRTVGSGVPLLEATYWQCREIIGSDDGPNGFAVFCGKRVPVGSPLSFCDEHLMKNTVSSSWRR